MKKIFLTLALAIGLTATAQVKVGDNVTTLNSNSLLELESTTKGLLFPRVALTGTTAFAPLAAHVAGMTVYNTATASDVTPGLYTNSGSAWVKLGGSTSTAYQNIVGGVQTISTNATILDSTYLVIYNGSNSLDSITLPTADIGKTFWVRNTGSVIVQIAGVGVGVGKGRCFIYDGSTWFMMTP
jgi:hypothetical protein